jgi:hypothetical protein
MGAFAWLVLPTRLYLGHAHIRTMSPTATIILVNVTYINNLKARSVRTPYLLRECPSWRDQCKKAVSTWPFGSMTGQYDECGISEHEPYKIAASGEEYLILRLYLCSSSSSRTPSSSILRQVARIILLRRKMCFNCGVLEDVGACS